MRAAVLESTGTPLRIVDDISLEAPRTGEVRVRIVACGVCHSDLSLCRGSFPLMGPTIPGHEAAGVVVECGPGVGDLAVGDHVVLSPAPACGRCAYCAKGAFSVCANSVGIATSSFPDGSTRLSRPDGIVHRGLNLAAWADEVVVPEQGAIRVHPDLPLDVACVIGCAVQTGVGAVVNTAPVHPGDAVVVFGAGGVGISVVQGAVLAGAATIVVSDPSPDRRALALRFGATHVVDPAADDPVAVVHSLTGIGADVAVDAAGSAALVEQALAAVRSGGTAVMVGAPPAEDEARVGVAAALFTEKRLVGSLLGSCWAPRDIPRLVDLWQAGRLDLDGLVTRRRPLEEVDAALDDLEAGRGLRTVLMVS